MEVIGKIIPSRPIKQPISSSAQPSAALCKLATLPTNYVDNVAYSHSRNTIALTSSNQSKLDIVATALTGKPGGYMVAYLLICLM